MDDPGCNNAERNNAAALAGNSGGSNGAEVQLQPDVAAAAALPTHDDDASIHRHDHAGNVPSVAQRHH